MEKAPEQDSLQGVTARLPPALLREIDAHAMRAGVTRSDSIRDLLAIGIETIRGRDGADEWEQALAEAESRLPEGPNAGSPGPRD